MSSSDSSFSSSTSSSAAAASVEAAPAAGAAEPEPAETVVKPAKICFKSLPSKAVAKTSAQTYN